MKTPEDGDALSNLTANRFQLTDHERYTCICFCFPSRPLSTASRSQIETECSVLYLVGREKVLACTRKQTIEHMSYATYAMSVCSRCSRCKICASSHVPRASVHAFAFSRGLLLTYAAFFSHKLSFGRIIFVILRADTRAAQRATWREGAIFVAACLAHKSN
jgi:hypothetical protein